MANIGDPFLLSSYAQPKSSSRAGPSGLPNVFASNQHASTSSSEGYATVAAQGDGVHILDLSTLHPVISYTLGPQVRFSCPPVTHTAPAGSSRICTTYAVIESAQDIPPDAKSRIVWRWKEDPAGNVTAAEANKRRTSAIAPHKVSRMYVPDELPEHVILVGPGSEVTVMDESLSTKSTRLPEDTETLLGCSVLPRRTTSFVLPSTEGSVIVTVGRRARDKSVLARILAVDAQGGSVVLGECPIVLEPSENIPGVTCSNTGYLSVLSSSGSWHSFELRHSDDETVTASKSTSTNLAAFSFVPAPPSTDSPTTQREVSIASVGSSHVLLCGFESGTNNDITILLWDLRYSVVLASQSYPIPATLGRSKKNPVEVTIVANPSRLSQALLVLSPRSTQPHPANGSSESRPDPNARSTILVVPLTVPATSKISNAIGRAAASKRWVSPLPSSSDVTPDAHDGARAKLLRTMKSSIDQKRAELADEAFFNWVKQEEARLPKSAPANEVQFGYKFVQDLLEILFKQLKAAADTMVYSPKVVRYLVERKVVSSGMVEGGLLPALRARNDWESMLLSLKNVIDIPETHLTTFLHDVIVSKSKAQDGDDSMQVDSSSAVTSLPNLQDLLALCVTYPTSAPAMRVAIRKHLREADELVTILKVLVKWTEMWCEEESKFLPAETKKDEHGVLVPLIEEKGNGNIPPLDKVLTFVQILLDSSFLTFLSHAPSHALIRRFMSLLQPELALNDEIEQLKGPLQPFVRAQAKAVSDAVNGPQKIDPKVDWRQRKKAMHEQASMNIGLYQVEELVL
ncbi:hypothetical protein BXZ70DRAFT_331420 [Cristinia sonorae]|uniref:Uncharacterized protein n=1 Tax=Cristinia sonorae TaxID=1940300 RepID=A0A8K0UL20_9AGAR|nr:hypothetical protein BXZ70DRAFT_331420 [Cristinia sonorae]